MYNSFLKLSKLIKSIFNLLPEISFDISRVIMYMITYREKSRKNVPRLKKLLQVSQSPYFSQEKNQLKIEMYFSIHFYRFYVQINYAHD